MSDADRRQKLEEQREKDGSDDGYEEGVQEAATARVAEAARDHFDHDGGQDADDDVDDGAEAGTAHDTAGDTAGDEADGDRKEKAVVDFGRMRACSDDAVLKESGGGAKRWLFTGCRKRPPRRRSRHGGLRYN